MWAEGMQFLFKWPSDSSLNVTVDPSWGGALESQATISIIPTYNPYITPIYYSSFHFLFHYPYITPRLPYIIPIPNACPNPNFHPGMGRF